MKFFVPGAKDSAQAEEVRASVMQFLKIQGSPVEERRIYQIAFKHNSKPYKLSVGELHPDLDEIVIFIFKAKHPQLYYACTPNRGVVHDGPYLIGDSVETLAVDFDEEG